MARIQTLNKIAEEGLAILRERGHQVGPDVADADGILVRSADLHDLTFPAELKAIARAGAGVNNIPLERCTEAGIAVFNTPGSNANSVKELVIAALLLSSRRILQGVQWTQSLVGGASDVAKEVEAGKSAFTGPEIQGKTLGVVGLGAIGVMVANAAEALGMRVIGYDPFLSVESAWGLSRSVRRASSLDAMLADADYVSLHAPLTADTRGLINSKRLAKLKPGARLLNFARGELVQEADVLAAREAGKLAVSATDFPTAAMLGRENVLTVPHLGASTPEAETNSAIMAATQLADYLDSGQVKNGVNFPDCLMERGGRIRLTVANKNVPNMVGQITTKLAERGINIADMLNRNRGGIAYNIIDLDQDVEESLLRELRAIEGVIMVRLINAG